MALKWDEFSNGPKKSYQAITDNLPGGRSMFLIDPHFTHNGVFKAYSLRSFGIAAPHWVEHRTFNTAAAAKKFAASVARQYPAMMKNPAPRKTVTRKTKATTMPAAKKYVRRASQITKAKPSKRLVNRRIKNLQVPEGVFPNPRKRHPGHKAVYTVEKWKRENNTVYGNAMFSFVLIDESGVRHSGKTKPNYDFVIGLPFFYPGDKITAILETTPSGRVYMTDTDEPMRRNPAKRAPKHAGAMDVAYPTLAKFSKDAKGCGYEPDELLRNGDYYVESDGHVLSRSFYPKENPASRKKEITVEQSLNKKNWTVFARFPDTPKGAENAVEYAKAFNKKEPYLYIRVITK